MNITHKDFIAQYTDVYPDGYCQHLIAEFERLASNGAGSNRRKSENAESHRKDDHQINMRAHPVLNFQNNNIVEIFFDGLQKCFEEYTGKYSILKEGKVNATHVKMQRTSPGGGYHVWHSEQGNGNQAERVLTYMLYLNTLQPEEAGETEFLYQQMRLRPQENTMILWPATFTHPHRGNTVFGNNCKYIVTGWFYYD